MVRCYQLTFEKGEMLGVSDDYLDALHDSDECPTEHLELLLDLILDPLYENYGCNYLAMSMERGGRTGRTHLHAYVQMAYPVQSMTAWHKMYHGVHVEVCKGTPDQNMDYLAKAGKWLNDVKHGTLKWGPIGWGEMTGGGAGSLEEYIELLDRGWRYEQLIRAYPQSLRYSYGLIKFEDRINKQKRLEKKKHDSDD